MTRSKNPPSDSDRARDGRGRLSTHRGLRYRDDRDGLTRIYQRPRPLANPTPPEPLDQTAKPLTPRHWVITVPMFHRVDRCGSHWPHGPRRPLSSRPEDAANYQERGPGTS